MGFESALTPEEIFDERAGQFMGWGIPTEVVTRARASVTSVWGEESSGWVPVWSAQARQAESRGAWLQAAMCWGAARFPCAATPARRDALERQLAAYRRAANSVPATFLRWSLQVPYRSREADVAVHIWRRPGIFGRSLLVISGGVDTWKVELHRAALAAAMLTGMTVAVLDMPGTGESQEALAADADEISRERWMDRQTSPPEPRSRRDRP